MFGYSGQELVGRPARMLTQANGREGQKDFFAPRQDLPMGQVLSVECRRRDGSTFPVDIGLSTIESNGKRLTVAFVADITQRRHLERAAQAHAEQVQALAARLLTAQEEERQAGIAGTALTRICQQLASLAIEIGGMAARSARRRMKKRRRCCERFADACDSGFPRRRGILLMNCILRCWTDLGLGVGAAGASCARSSATMKASGCS